MSPLEEPAEWEESTGNSMGRYVAKYCKATYCLTPGCRVPFVMTGKHPSREDLSSKLEGYQPYAEVNLRDDHNRPMTCKVLPPQNPPSTPRRPSDPASTACALFSCSQVHRSVDLPAGDRGEFLHVVNDEQVPPFTHPGRPMSTYDITLRVNSYFRTAREEAFLEPIRDLKEEARRDSKVGGYFLFV